MSWIPKFGGYGGTGATGGAPPSGDPGGTSKDDKDKGKGSIRARIVLQALLRQYIDDFMFHMLLGVVNWQTGAMPMCFCVVSL